MALSSTGLIKNESFGRASFTSTDHAPPTTMPTSVSSTKPTRPINLPIPTYLPQDPTKKSHARKQPHGHVRRPRNAFILFRCDFVRQKKVPDDVENDHRNISRIVGTVWRQMSEREREPWVRMAEREKRLHRKVYPGYRYSPAGEAVGGKKKKRGDVSDGDGDGDVCAQRRSSSCPPVQPMDQPTRGRVSSRPQVPAFTIIPPTVPAIPDLLSLRRSSSCPPGAPRIASSATTLPDETALLVTRDDLARRPSRVVMYQTSPSPLSFPSPASSSSLFSLDPDQHHQYTFVRDLGPHTRPVLETGAYRLGPPGDAPGWDSAPRDPIPWSWDELGTSLNGAGFFPTFTNPFGLGSGFSGGEEAFAGIPFPASMSVPPHETNADKVKLFSNMGATVGHSGSSTPQAPFNLNLALLPPPMSSSLRSTPMMKNNVELTGFNDVFSVSTSTTPRTQFSPPPPSTFFVSPTSSSPSSSSVPHGFLHNHHHDLTSTSTPVPDNDLNFGMPMLRDFSRMSIDAEIVGMGEVGAELLGSGYSDCDLGYDFTGGDSGGAGYFSG
ncbi:hypothetical protein Hypma_002958 [Hypsizygus marmoreus]|uniref:HMG box domain-containing protein n=1 Tax=Hypsizygus marmoreus TaxID=39966 RepID=A0A369J5R2_HYPMA|nr:hypothetical protein Hypma_002958 [Hypsizygus marmoreus]